MGRIYARFKEKIVMLGGVVIKKVWRFVPLIVILILLVVVSIWKPQSGHFTTMEEAKTILQNKHYDVVEKNCIELANGTQVQGQFLLATKGEEFAILYTLDNSSLGEMVHDTLAMEYKYNYYVEYYDNYYVLTKKATKDMNLEKYLVF